MAGAATEGAVRQHQVQITQIDDVAYAALDGVVVYSPCDYGPLTMRQQARVLRRLAEELDQVAEGL